MYAKRNTSCEEMWTLARLNTLHRCHCDVLGRHSRSISRRISHQSRAIQGGTTLCHPTPCSRSLFRWLPIRLICGAILECWDERRTSKCRDHFCLSGLQGDVVGAGLSPCSTLSVRPAPLWKRYKILRPALCSVTAPPRPPAWPWFVSL